MSPLHTCTSLVSPGVTVGALAEVMAQPSAILFISGVHSSFSCFWTCGATSQHPSVFLPKRARRFSPSIDSLPLRDEGLSAAPTPHWNWADLMTCASIYTECSAWKWAARWLHWSLMCLVSRQWNVSLQCLILLNVIFLYRFYLIVIKGVYSIHQINVAEPEMLSDLFRTLFIFVEAWHLHYP